MSYLELADDLFAVVFGADVNPHCDEISAVNMFLPDTPLAFLDTLYPFPLETTCLPLLLGLAAFIGRVGAGA